MSRRFCRSRHNKKRLDYSRRFLFLHGYTAVRRCRLLLTGFSLPVRIQTRRLSSSVGVFVSDGDDRLLVGLLLLLILCVRAVRGSGGGRCGPRVDTADFLRFHGVSSFLLFIPSVKRSKNYTTKFTFCQPPGPALGSPSLFYGLELK